MARIVIEEPCEHDELNRHFVWLYVPDAYWCPGGSRRVLDPGSYVLVEKVDGEWPEWLVREAPYVIGYLTDDHDGFNARQIENAHDAFRGNGDALAGGEQP